MCGHHDPLAPGGVPRGCYRKKEKSLKGENAVLCLVRWEKEYKSGGEFAFFILGLMC